MANNAKTALGLIAALAFPAFVRLRLADLPLERDEGEYAYAGWLMLQGIPPYELAYNMKFPGTYAAYAAVMGILGDDVRGIRLGMLLVTSITAVLVYVLGARLIDRTAGVLAAAMYAMLALTPAAFALHGHATHFISPFVVGAIILVIPSVSEGPGWAGGAPPAAQVPRYARDDRWRLAAAGALLAIAVLMKQPAIFFLLFAAAWVFARSSRRLRDVASLVAGAALVTLITLAALAATGVLDRFRFWTIDYAREYLSEIPLAAGFAFLRGNLGDLIASAPAIWLVAAIGLVVRRQWLLAGLLASAALATAPGLYFRHHYFIVLFPVLALLAANLPERVRVPACVAAIALTMAMNWSAFTRMSPEELTRRLYGHSPFIESVPVANYLRQHTQPGDRIVVLGSEPQIYFLAKRNSATGYIYAYPLMEEHPFAARMQEEMVREIEAADPKYLVFVGTRTSWQRRPGSPDVLIEWFRAQMPRMQAEGIVDITPDGTEYVWGERARTYRWRSDNFLIVYRRR